MKKITPSISSGALKAALLNCSFIVLLSAGHKASAQVTLPHYDGLDYTVGQSLPSQTAGGWVLNQSATTDMLITAGSLNYTGLATSTGNKVAFAGGGEDAIKVFTQTSSGKVYYSYLFNITDVSNLTSGYFAGILPNSAATATAAPGSGSIAATVWVKPSANTGFFNIGFSARANQTTVGTTASSLQYSAVDYLLNTPVLVVVSYEMIAGSANDICNMWVNPVPGSPEPVYSFTASPTTDIADVSGFFIKQNGNTSTPGAEMDEIRFGLTWADVTPGAAVAVITPTLVADISDATVDHNIDITFTDDATWRAAVTDVKIGSGSLIAGTDYEFTEGNLRLMPSGLNALLTTAGSKEITVVATGYDDATVSQIIAAGVPTANSVVAISTPLTPGGTSTITATAKDQFNNLVEGYGFTYSATIVNNDATTTESYIIDGATQTASATNVALQAATDATGGATLVVALPTVIDGSESISIQLQLADGTAMGNAFVFTQLASQSITFNELAAVTYGDAAFNLDATASSALPITYTSSDTAVATVATDGTVTVVGIGITTITASQAGNESYLSATSVSRNLVVNCATPTAEISGSTTICLGEGATLQVAVTSVAVQQYTVVYTDGTTQFTVNDYTSGANIAVSPSAGTTYSLVSVTGTNPNICNATVSGTAQVDITATPAPTGDATQVFNTDEPVHISNLVAEGTSVEWFASVEAALSGEGALEATTVVVTNTTYYAMQTVSGCRSIAPLAVTVTVNLGVQGNALSGLKYYPNPVGSALNINYPEAITNIKIFNALGQVVLTANPNAVNPVVNVQALPAGNYFMQIQSSEKHKTLQLLKQ